MRARGTNQYNSIEDNYHYIVSTKKYCELSVERASDALEDATPQSTPGVEYAAPSGAAHTTPSSGILAGGIGELLPIFSKVK